GCIQASGTFEEVMKYVYKWNIDLNRHDVDDVNSPKTEILQKRQISEPNRKVDDERGEESKTDGYVPWKIYWNFFRNGGNTFFILMIAFLALASSAFNNGSDYWLKIWVENANKLGSLHENENHGKKITESTSKNWNSSSDCLKFTSFFSNATCSSSQAYFLDVFVLLVFLNILFITLSCVYNSTICMRSTRKLHDTMFDRMLHVPMYFFNMNPIGRILNRFAKDVGNVDDQLPHVFRNFVAMVAFSIVSMVIICIQSYYLVIPLVLMVLLFFPISYLYFSTCQTLKRIDNSTNRSGTVGFIFTQVVQAGAASHLVLRVFAELQSQFTSVERIMEYGDLSPEASKVSSPDKKPVSSWPNTGEIKFKDVSLRYKSTEPYILKSLNFQIKSKEKIGIVGRTGAGKTSMINALFRLVEPEGTIEIDGVIVNDIGLHDLRHRLSVIPQEPLIFADTIRYNLDPFNELDDYDLWDVLTDVELASVVGAFPHKLNTMLGSETNLSFGQSQLVCLARAILKRNKILILDEATSNVDQ
ncbi:ABCC4 (predicted), partial [Pycnogonum litorale]